MKKIMLTLGLLAGAATVFSLTASPGICAQFSLLRSAVFRWSATTHDFGTIKQNVPVSHKFTFRNNGDTPLVISSVQASCGCTVTEYSKEPVEPGAEGFVNATYNASSMGVFSKTVSVRANTDEGIVQLTIKGVVVE